MRVLPTNAEAARLPQNEVKSAKAGESRKRDSQAEIRNLFKLNPMLLKV